MSTINCIYHIDFIVTAQLSDLVQHWISSLFQGYTVQQKVLQSFVIFSADQTHGIHCILVENSSRMYNVPLTIFSFMATRGTSLRSPESCTRGCRWPGMKASKFRYYRLGYKLKTLGEKSGFYFSPRHNLFHARGVPR